MMMRKVMMVRLPPLPPPLPAAAMRLMVMTMRKVVMGKAMMAMTMRKEMMVEEYSRKAAMRLMVMTMRKVMMVRLPPLPPPLMVRLPPPLPLPPPEMRLMATTMRKVMMAMTMRKVMMVEEYSRKVPHLRKPTTTVQTAQNINQHRPTRMALPITTRPTKKKLRIRSQSTVNPNLDQTQMPMERLLRLTRMVFRTISKKTTSLQKQRNPPNPSLPCLHSPMIGALKTCFIRAHKACRVRCLYSHNILE